MPKNRKSNDASGDRELLGLFVAFTGFAVGYFLAEGLLTPFAHPIHWIAAGATGLLGYVLSVLLYSLLHKNKNMSRRP